MYEDGESTTQRTTWQMEKMSIYSITVFRLELELSHHTYPGSNKILRPPSFRFTLDNTFPARLIGNLLIITTASGNPVFNDDDLLEIHGCDSRPSGLTC